MGTLFDYLQWRGDIPFTQVPVNQVDALIFSALSYIRFEGVLPEDSAHPVPLPVAAQVLCKLPDAQDRDRVRQDLPLLRAAAESSRFGSCQVCCYRSRFTAADEGQFAAMTFLLPDGSALLAYRGTDDTLVGWKEDFNMCFKKRVPAQLEAAQYLKDVAAQLKLPLYLAGHSKGGNIAVYAAANAGRRLQPRILRVYNLDGPGFNDDFMAHPGYRALIPKIQTYIPESSIIGMLLEHEEHHSVIKSRNIGILQHELYNWEIQGGGFIHLAEISPNTRFAERAIEDRLREMSPQQREDFIEALYRLVVAGGASNVRHLLHPKTFGGLITTLVTDGKTRKVVTSEFAELLRSAFNATKKDPK